jgi:predicted dehydrogenase
VRGTNRRSFLAAAGAAVSLPALVPATALGANERLNVGHIGVGGRAGSLLGYDLNLQGAGMTQVVALCDIDEGRLAGAAKRVSGATPYFDYREMLQRQDIDAVMIGTPDHWHAVQTVHACESGKHVYVEKPSSVTIEEGNAMMAAANRHGRVIQVGSQARSAEPAHQACLYIRNGMIGQVKKVTCWHRTNPTAGPTPDSPPPSEKFWDMWLGPLRWRPHNNTYYPGKFRFIMESGGGVIRDRGAHVLSVIRWCMNADDQHPVSVEATGTAPKHGLYDCPVEMEVIYTFKNPDWQVVWAQPGQRESNYPDKNRDFGMVFHGEKDKLILDRDGTRYAAPDKARQFKVPPGGVHVARVDKHGDYNMNHVEDWYQAVKTGRQPIMHIEAGHNAATMCIIGNLSYVLGRKLQWDGKNQQFVNDDQANRLLGRPQRHPYHL